MKKIVFLYMLSIGMLLTACQNKEYLYRDVSSRLWLGKMDTVVGRPPYRVDSSEATFLLAPPSKLKDTLYIYANVVGEAKPFPRTFKVEILPSQTNVSPSDYVIGATVIPPNTFNAKIPVEINRNVPGIDLNKQRARISMILKSNENFLNLAASQDTFRITWSNFLQKPLDWPKVEFYLGAFSQARYKFILVYYGPIDFTRYAGNANLSVGLQSALRKLLRDYNADPTNQGNPDGWPYRNDNGTPLTF